jgi:REP element-mobilizing transposase RayT
MSFSTKDRERCFDSDMLPRVHAYLATICRDLGAEFVRVGGVADHVHIVTTLPRTISPAELIEQIKKVSSKWIKPLEGRYHDFFWQRWYGAFRGVQVSLALQGNCKNAKQKATRLRAFPGSSCAPRGRSQPTPATITTQGYNRPPITDHWGVGELGGGAASAEAAVLLLA